jgi:GYF domain 2
MYYIARDGQQYGPYSADTVRQYLAAGSLLTSDMAREESGQTWLPLGQLMSQAPPMTLPMAPPIVPPIPPYSGGAAFGGPQIASQPMISQIIPPDLHWALVLLLGFTGIFTFVWVLIQASYARKIDPANKAMVFYILWIVGVIINFFISVTVIVSMAQTGVIHPGMAAVQWVFNIANVTFFLLGGYGIRRSMLDYYNIREPIQLRLGGVMTFFFSTLYLQYHMSRIAKWKKTGYLSPQQ